MAGAQWVVIADDLGGSIQQVDGVWIGMKAKLYEVHLRDRHRHLAAV